MAIPYWEHAGLRFYCGRLLAQSTWTLHNNLVNGEHAPNPAAAEPVCSLPRLQQPGQQLSSACAARILLCNSSCTRLFSATALCRGWASPPFDSESPGHVWVLRSCQALADHTQALADHAQAQSPAGAGPAGPRPAVPLGGPRPRPPRSPRPRGPDLPPRGGKPSPLALPPGPRPPDRAPPFLPLHMQAALGSTVLQQLIELITSRLMTSGTPLPYQRPLLQLNLLAPTNTPGSLVSLVALSLPLA